MQSRAIDSIGLNPRRGGFQIAGTNYRPVSFRKMLHPRPGITQDERPGWLWTQRVIPRANRVKSTVKGLAVGLYLMAIAQQLYENKNY
jgi:hypothetical protein